MPSIRILSLESKNDPNAVKCLANKLATFLQLGPTRIYAAGKSKSLKQLKKAVQNYLRKDDFVILVVDSDGPITRHQRLRQPNSLINQAKQIVNDRSFAGKVFLVEAIQELEAWLLIDCIGIFCYFATKRAHYRDDCRVKVSENSSLKNLVNRYQKGNTETIVGTGIGGKGAKEHLIEFSVKILRELNPKLSSNDIKNARYRATISPEVAKHIEINKETLQRNNSLKKLGDVIAQFQ